jgi:hypothetical protein
MLEDEIFDYIYNIVPDVSMVDQEGSVYVEISDH